MSSPQALQVVLPSASLLQRGVVLVWQLKQTIPPAKSIPEPVEEPLLLSEGQPAQAVFPPVPLHWPSPGQDPRGAGPSETMGGLEEGWEVVEAMDGECEGGGRCWMGLGGIR